MNDKDDFYLDEYITRRSLMKRDDPVRGCIRTTRPGKEQGFYNLCSLVKTHFDGEWAGGTTDKERRENSVTLLERQKRAIIGYPKEVNFYKDKIKDYLRKNNLIGEWYPPWHENLPSAIYHEVWGLAGLAPWCEDQMEEYKSSSSAKIIGDRIYFYINGRMELQPQRISAERRLQLKKALLLPTPGERMGKGEHEVYLLSGIRITIFTDNLVKRRDGATNDVFVLRKYVVPEYKLEHMASRGTIPQEALPLFQAMIQIGYNVCFTGPVRSGKTTMMTCWQMEENPQLEGVMVETDPEIPMDKLMPESPIVELLADGAELERLIKPLLRVDPEYIIMAEARDAVAFNAALDITDRGTRRSKLTTHFTHGKDLPAAMAKKIAEKYGGSQRDIACRIARNVNYVLEMTMLPSNKAEKRMKGLYELRYDADTDTLSSHQICRYDFLQDTWTWRSDIGLDKAQIGLEENPQAFQDFKLLLRELEQQAPMEGQSVFCPSFEGSR